MTNPDQAGQTFYLETYGCQMNVYDSNAMASILTRAGFRRVDDPELAAVVLLNTCSVREHAEHRVVSRIGELRQNRERAGLAPVVLAVCGCMAERMGEALLRHGQRVDLVVGVDQYDRLPGLIAASGPVNPHRVAVGHRGDHHYVAPPELYPTNNSHLVTIHKGCDYKCTYCIVPATRGPQREKHPDVILDEVRKVVAAGGREVTLLGQNVTAYRWQDRHDFADLLATVADVAGVERVRFLTGHPRDMSERLMDVIGGQPKICPWLHVPIQSGSDPVLRRMKRLYKRADYLRMVDYARQTIPDVTFSSDFIVGFPGETAADFEQTLAVVREVGFDQIFSFKYSARPGTPAERLADDVPLAAKKERLAALMAVQAEVWQRLAAAQVGQRWRAVVEGPARRPAASWRLRTANNRKVVVSLAAARVGDLLEVEVTGHANTTFLARTMHD